MALINTKRKTEVRCSQSCNPLWAWREGAEGEGLRSHEVFSVGAGVGAGPFSTGNLESGVTGRSGGNEGKLHGDA